MTLSAQLIQDCVRTACELEVLSPKPGNVSPDQEFSNASVTDFLRSASVIAPILADAGSRTPGETILAAVEATRAAVGHNTNLGIILLLTPLAAAAQQPAPLPEAVREVLKHTTVADSRCVYQAIRLAEPAGLGEVREQDLSHVPTESLTECMRLAASRDLIARQYASGFQDVFEFALPRFTSILPVNSRENGLSGCKVAPQDCQPAVTQLAVHLIAEYGDSLVSRKCGADMSDRIQQMARQLLDTGWPTAAQSIGQYAAFDGFLRADGNQRNPGTTADMVAATVFCALVTGLIEIPAAPLRAAP